MSVAAHFNPIAKQDTNRKTSRGIRPFAIKHKAVDNSHNSVIIQMMNRATKSDTP